MNTNGAGDGALAALLHDITANSYHRSNVPNSSKHKFTRLTYSSLAQVCKYANRVSYQVLNQHSPRLTRGLPEREDSPKSLTGIVKLSSVRRPDKAFTPHLAFRTQNRLIAARRPALQLIAQVRRRAFNGQGIGCWIPEDAFT